MGDILIDINAEEGDLFLQHIQTAIEKGCTIIVGERWGLWGKWLYAGENGELVGLLSRAYRSKEWNKAYCVKPGYEKLIEAIYEQEVT